MSLACSKGSLQGLGGLGVALFCSDYGCVVSVFTTYLIILFRESAKRSQSAFPLGTVRQAVTKKYKQEVEGT